PLRTPDRLARADYWRVRRFSSPRKSLFRSIRKLCCSAACGSGFRPISTRWTPRVVQGLNIASSCLNVNGLGRQISKSHAQLPELTYDRNSLAKRLTIRIGGLQVYKVILINMPFANVRMPSIALTQLQSRVLSALDGRVSVDILNLNHDFAKYLGLDLYGYLTDSFESQNG